MPKILNGQAKNKKVIIMIIDNKKIAIYNHGAKGTAYSVNGLNMAQCEKVLQKLYGMYEKVNTEYVKISPFKDQCNGYILAK